MQPTPASEPSSAAIATSERPVTTAMWAAGGVLLAAAAVLAISGGTGPLTAPKAIVLGAVEGITEYLPVSSTGHLLVTQRLLGLGTGAGKTAADTYAVAIQLGAIAAVITVFWSRLQQLLAGLIGRDADGRRLLIRLITAFAPAALVGIAFDNTIKAHLFGPWPVIAAWGLGGILLLVWRPRPGRVALEGLTTHHALIIGGAQVLALWPGVSRSLVTIAGALAIGATMSTAVEFSFLLGLATLTAATALDLTKDGPTLLADYGWRTPLLGAIVAFLTAVVAVRWLVIYLRTKPLTVFGGYRLAIAAVTVALVATHAI